MSQDEPACGCEARGHNCCLRFREEWTPGSIYRPGDAVPYRGSSYVTIHWNQNDPPPSGNWATIAAQGNPGPAGPPGQTGPAGMQGPPGVAGPSDLYISTSPGDDINVGTQGQYIIALEVPAGSYMISGVVNLVNQDSDTQNWTVELYQDSTLLVGIDGSESGNGQGISIGDDNLHGVGVPILTALRVTEKEAALRLRVVGYSIHVGPKAATLVALKVNSIHSS